MAKHIFISGRHELEEFTSIQSWGSKPRILQHDRQSHSKFLARQFREAWEHAAAGQLAVAVPSRHGVYLEFKGEPGHDLVTKSLEDMRSKKVRLLNTRTEGRGEESVKYATVYVANDKRDFFLRKIRAYAEEDDPRSNKPKNYNLANSIADISHAFLAKSFWRDSPELIPAERPAWCEVWLSSDKDVVVERFEALLREEDIEAAIGTIRFPERSVKVIQANGRQLERLISLSDDIAEYRRAKETAAFWVEMENEEQAEWVKDLLDRLDVVDDPSVAVCILDTGVNNGHPLLRPILREEDCQAVDPSWGTHDHDERGHGTGMAGLAAYGDLRECLASASVVSLGHGLESVKLLPPTGQTKPELWGAFTSQAVSLAEIQTPARKRVICMAVSADDTRDQGRPSSWSGALDQLAAGVEDNHRRLFVVCAGNAAPYEDAADYPASQETDAIHDPAQSWNALTVGAYTELAEIRDTSLSGYEPLAPTRGLSPFSTTSLVWGKEWPLKPDIVMEGGNLAHSGGKSVTTCDDLSLISTYHDTAVRHFYGFDMTSAATAQAAWFAAQIMNAYPDIWPETVRALMVHSAEWTDELKRQFLKAETKPAHASLLRVCGYGVPNLQRALQSASDYLTLIAQAEMQPYERRVGGGGYKSKDMHLYELPWPTEALLGMPSKTNVRMRVTLSYFIEPGPGEIGWRDRYRYASHVLRFGVRSPGETTEEFRKRINKAARDEDEDTPGTSSASDYWKIGSQTRRRGSLHSDIWEGSAADLARSGVVAVYPAVGWWRTRAHLGRWNKECRYSLIVSISSPEVGVDIYTPVANQVSITVPTNIPRGARRQQDT
ncbi:MAG: S8 family peptidase [Planctomycetota bacterium]|jgi:hypothetical protein